jgi:hypothetical protein
MSGMEAPYASFEPRPREAAAPWTQEFEAVGVAVGDGERAVVAAGVDATALFEIGSTQGLHRGGARRHAIELAREKQRQISRRAAVGLAG